MKPSIEWAKAIGLQVAVLVFLIGALVPFGLFPWATQRDIEAVNLHHIAKMEVLVTKIDELNLKYDAVMVMKNQDNIWYRELADEVAGGLAALRVEIINLKSDVKEMNGDVKTLIKEGQK